MPRTFQVQVFAEALRQGFFHCAAEALCQGLFKFIAKAVFQGFQVFGFPCGTHVHHITVLPDKETCSERPVLGSMVVRKEQKNAALQVLVPVST